MSKAPFRFELELPARPERRTKNAGCDLAKIFLGVPDTAHLDCLATFIWESLASDAGFNCHFLSAFGKKGALPDRLRKLGLESSETITSVELTVTTLEQTKNLFQFNESELVAFFKKSDIKTDFIGSQEETYIASLHQISPVIFFAPSHLSIEIFSKHDQVEELAGRSLKWWKLCHGLASK